MPRPLRIRLKRCKILYIRLLLFILGRALPRAVRVSRQVKNRARRFPRNYRILLGVREPGPVLLIESDGEGGLYRVSSGGNVPDLEIRFKSIEAAFRLFTFRESTAASEAAGRLIVSGSLAMVLDFIRIIDAEEILLLPRFLAKRAVKLWQKPPGLFFKRLALYLSLLLPAPKRRNP
ncbi:hypothetical protein [Marispirochaeta sp.]|uniref:hypothetical protein n=1 Tax=Marispirochaeta sp. TaxID=2038653 RepID=UPI0029C93F4C|nr:hypothetical protein [Marispirochaeta sp.]